MDGMKPRRPVQPQAGRPQGAPTRPPLAPPAAPIGVARPPLRPGSTSPEVLQARAAEVPPVQPRTEDSRGSQAKPAVKKRCVWKWILSGIGAMLVMLLAAAIAGYFWYTAQLAPVSGDKDAPRVRVEIKSGMTPTQIADLLEKDKVIRSATAFSLYVRLEGVRGELQASTYSLSPNETTQQIVEHLRKGATDEFTLTFLPGATLTSPASVADDKRVDHQWVLRQAGYSQPEIDAAFAAVYDHPVLKSKPATVGLEGYIYGQTYQFFAGATVKQVITRTLDELYTVVKDNNLEAAYAAQGFTLYQGITMASIIQREVISAEDQKQVAQIFIDRYKEGMMLGSDITAYYGADLLGVARTVAVDSPYNTRKYVGLPPGPIASPGLSALLAVAQPSPGNYVYFLSGDDDKTYYARTAQEHDKNIVNHCQIKCSIP